MDSTWTPSLVETADCKIVRFPSVGSLVRFALGKEAGCRCDKNEQHLADFVERHNGQEFWNSYTVERFLGELQRPSRDRLDAVNEMRKYIRLSLPPRPGVGRRLKLGLPDGEELDPMAWVRRDPDGWAGLVRVQRPQMARLVRIGCNINAHCGQTQRHVLHRGAAVCALADELTSRGRSVEIVAFVSLRDVWTNGGPVVMRLTVKRAGEPLDLASLSLVLADIAFMRIAVIPAMVKLAPAQVRRGLGVVADVPASQAADLDTLAEMDIETRSAAVKYVSQETESHCGPDRNAANGL